MSKVLAIGLTVAVGLSLAVSCAKSETRFHHQHRGYVGGWGYPSVTQQYASQPDVVVRHSSTTYNAWNYQSPVIQYEPYRPYRVWNWGTHPSIQQVPQPTSAEGLALQAAEDESWVAFCQPVRNVDKYGVTRLSYAKEGCEFGRTQ